MPSPVRRSTRAAAPSSKPPPPASSASTSSLSSAKAERNVRGSNLGKSATPRSLSSEEPSEPPRRSKRSLAVQDEEAIQDSKEDDQGGGDEEEVTRCICGQQEYPGPPQSEAFTAADAQSEDAGGLFIQCDGCSVWQHGGCVGIVEESQCPDKYYCEECRPKQHDVRKDSRGQKYSLYLPLHPKAHRKSSSSKYDEKAKRERDSVASRASTEPGRRRATMRSKEHDDEEEQIMRAIEESKREVDSGNGKRNGKRSRDDSDDSKQESKRQRRASESVPAVGKTVPHEDESGDESSMPLTGSKAKKARAEAALTARNAEMREKEKEREKTRAEAAGRRQERAGRRRVDESEPLDDPTTSRPSPPPSSQPSPPPAAQSVHKKPGKKTRKLGNNQYTKARELAAQGTTGSPHSRKRQLHTAASGDEQLANGDSKNSPIQEATNGNGKGKYGKGKNKLLNGNKQTEEIEKTIPNMKRALDSMQAWIARQQHELAGSEPPPGVEGSSLAISPGGGAVQPAATSEPAAGRDFGSLSALEMADTLSKSIVHWQHLYGSISTQ